MWHLNAKKKSISFVFESVTVRLAGVGRHNGCAGFLKKTSCCLCGAASKQATHQERGSEECFLPDCLSCCPLLFRPTVSVWLCVCHTLPGREECVFVRVKTAEWACVYSQCGFVCLDMDFPCALWRLVLRFGVSGPFFWKIHPSDRVFIYKRAFYFSYS